LGGNVLGIGLNLGAFFPYLTDNDESFSNKLSINTLLSGKILVFSDGMAILFEMGVCWRIFYYGFFQGIAYDKRKNGMG